MMGETVRAARASRGMTQAELAQASGIDQPNISAIENDRRRPSVETLIQLLASCGYELVAVAGDRTLRLPLHPDDAPGDVPRERPLDVSDEERAEILLGALDMVDEILDGRA